MNSGLLIGVLAIYIATLFACAFFGGKYTSRLGQHGRMLLFSLTLGVYCTSWTFYGSVGESVRNGIGFLPVYLGPLLFLGFGYDVWRRLGNIRQQQPISSIADFMAARYGKSGYLAALVTLLAVMAILPYLALQLRAIAASTMLLLDQGENSVLATDGVLLLTALLTAVAMLFGTRQSSRPGQQSGLMVAVAIESAVKLVVLLVLALFVLLFSQHPAGLIAHDIGQTFQHIQRKGLPDAFWTQTLLAAAAIICLPRQFHVTVVELSDKRHLRGARFWFSVYLLLMVLAVIPIASWALHAPIATVPIPDMAVLLLPLSHGQNGLALLAYIGGFSAATGMLLVATLTLSIMLSNDLILPALWRLRIVHKYDRRLACWIQTIRRVCIAVVMLLGFMMYHLLADSSQLSDFGILAFSAVIQFAPALIGGLYWRGGSSRGVMIGLFAGFALWSYTLFWPAILRHMPGLQQDWALSLLNHGPWQQFWLRPESLLGFAALDPLTHGVLWSLGVNLLLYMLVPRYKPLTIAEQLQAERFFKQEVSEEESAFGTRNLPATALQQTQLTLDDLIGLSSRINGPQPTEAAFKQFAADQQLPFDRNMLADHHWWQFTEQYLASAVGTASARTLLTTVLVRNGLAVDQVMSILDQASQWQRFNQSLLLIMMDYMTQAVSVVDAEMRLVAWNRRYLELFDYPENFIYVGCPVAKLIRYNAERGECGYGDVEEHVNKRIRWMRAGNPHVFERQRTDGRVIEMRGQPIAGGGFVTTYADITVFRHTEALLEARVQKRTQQLERALREQQYARQQADLANSSKTRFIAAASHDLLQPMHAARLFVAALQHSGLAGTEQQTLQQLDRALHGAESIMTALLDIARLDSQGMQPSICEFALHDLLHDLQVQFSPIATQRGLQLRVHSTRLCVKTDPQWLRRMLQNFISNALRYTAQGRVIVGVRASASQPDHLRVGVWDTGPGIAPEQQAQLFAEFQRAGHVSPWGEQGIGLGLAIVERMARRLGHRIDFHSQVGRGSCFMLELPAVAPRQHAISNVASLPNSLPRLNVLCLDNDAAILQGMQLLLNKWGCQLFLAQTPEQARQLLNTETVQVLLVDQHLNAGIEGLDFLLQYNTGHIPAALITADSNPDLPQLVKQHGIVLLKKPVKPAALRAFLAGIRV